MAILAPRSVLVDQRPLILVVLQDIHAQPDAPRWFELFLNEIRSLSESIIRIHIPSLFIDLDYLLRRDLRLRDLRISDQRRVLHMKVHGLFRIVLVDVLLKGLSQRTTTTCVVVHASS